ncbi:unnamed protein product [Schistosoma margrebowiei]|uniref:Uncharacterized protein n=1 Tax=Schistosoma margrebowiei TaxID=48269 RepID=A0A183MVS0_9TREM|nr:unnamed protein product [Schistosoma margrebowiei]
MQEKTNSVAAASAAAGLNIHKGKSKILQYNITCINQITLDGEALEDVKTLTYLGSIINEHGRSDVDVKARIGKTRAEYLQLRNVWNSKQLSTNAKDTDKLNKFKIVLSDKFQAFHDLLSGEGTTMESNWKRIKKAITSTCHEVLGHKKRHHKEWITVDTLDKIQERRNKKAAINTSRTRAEKAKAQAEYTEVNKQVKRSIRTDKR